MSLPTMNAALRTDTGKGFNRRLRAAGRVPAVVYGNGKEPTAVSIEPKLVAKLLNGEFGRNTVMNVVIEGQSEPRLCIFKDYQVHPWKRTLVHVDLWEISPDKRLVLEVPFGRTGLHVTEKLGGRVEIIRRTIKVSCLPDKVPAIIEYDVSQEAEDSTGIRVSQLTMPDGLIALYKSDYAVLRIRPPKAEIAAAEAEEGEEAAPAGAEE